MDWSRVTLSENIYQAATAFNVIFTKIVDKHLPWKKIRIRANSAAWINNEFLSLLDAREYHSRQYNICPCPFHFEKWRLSRLVAHHMKLRLKREYVKNCLAEHKNDSKKLWHEIRQFWPSSKSNSTMIGDILGADTIKGKAEKIECSLCKYWP